MVSLRAALLCNILLLSSLGADVKAFHHILGKVYFNRRVRFTTLTVIKKDDTTEPLSDSLSTPQYILPSWGDPSYWSNFFNSISNDKNEHITASSWWGSFLLAATVMWSTVSNGGPPPANASLDISPGTTVFETSPDLTQRKLLQSTSESALKIAQTAIVDRNDLLQSLKRLKSAASTEFTSIKAWQDVWSIIQMYGLDLTKEISIRPPVDLRRTFQDLVQEGKVNFLVNGEVVQVSLEYSTGKDAVETQNRNKGDISKQKSAGGASVVTPDDEWILKVQGYRGTVPASMKVAAQTPKYDAIPFARNFWEYWTTRYPEQYLSQFLIPTKETQRHVTYGDILVLEGTLAVGFLYAWAYAYYVDEMEAAENANNVKRRAKQKGGAATKETNGPVAAKKKDKEETETVQVSIDFDATGHMVITTSENESRDGVWAFLQALYFPWLGMFVPSLTAPEKVVISKSDKGETEGLVPFLRALYFPWLGILQGN
jgi:hypothetical protein